MERDWFEYELVESKIFQQGIKDLCDSEDEEDEIKRCVCKNRYRGDRLNKEGIRKIRVPLRSKGTRGGARVIYFFTDETFARIFFLMIYSKAEKEDLTNKELNILTNYVLRELEKGVDHT